MYSRPYIKFFLIYVCLSVDSFMYVCSNRVTCINKSYQKFKSQCRLWRHVVSTLRLTTSGSCCPCTAHSAWPSRRRSSTTRPMESGQCLKWYERCFALINQLQHYTLTIVLRLSGHSHCRKGGCWVLHWPYVHKLPILSFRNIENLSNAYKKFLKGRCKQPVQGLLNTDLFKFLICISID